MSSILRLLIFTMLLLGLKAVSAAEPTLIQRGAIQPFVDKYCIQCHGAEEQEGDVRFDTIEWKITDNASAQHWQDMLDVLNAGDMPPEDEKQPGSVEMGQIIGILTSDLSVARKRLAATGGINPIRRINKREYLNSMKHLFGLNIHESLIPDDVRTEHFDTAGGEQYIDGPLLEQYFRIGIEIAQEGLEWSARPYQKARTVRQEGEKSYQKRSNYDLSRPKSDRGFYLDKGNRTMRGVGIDLGDDPRASYQLRLRAGLYEDAHPVRHFLEVSKFSAVRGQKTPLLGVLRVTGSVAEPSVSEMLIRREALSKVTDPKVNLSEVMPEGITNPNRWFPIYLSKLGVERGKPNVWIDWLEVEGPFYDRKNNVLGDLIQAEGKNWGKKEKARDFLEKFAFEAFRRVPPSARYMNRLTHYFGLRMKDGLSYEEALGEALGLILISPGFLYLEEPQVSGSKALDSRAFATRLSYFLWSAPPDEELYAAAQSGALAKGAELRKQVIRMLNDPKAESFFEGFMGQWSELERFDGVSVKWDENWTFNSGVRYSAGREPIEFFKALVRENLPVDHFIDSNFIMADALLAQFYGLPGKHDFEGFQKIALPKNSNRGGFITQSAFLTMGSNGVRTSPVIRGTLILEKLLNNPPPEPPPNVPEIEAASDKPLTNRELVELHRKQEVCASCHDKIDPIGFGLEHFDTVGLWRESERVGKKSVPIQSGGTLASGTKFKNLQGLQRLLKTKEEDLARNLIESLISYGIGRPVEFSDQERVDEVAKLVKQRGFAMQDLVFLVAQSEIFRSK